MTGCLVDVVAVMGEVFILVYNFHVPLALKVGCPSNGVGCDIALAFIFLCVGLMAIFCGVTSYSGFFCFCVYLVFLSRGVVCLDCWWSFCVFRYHPHHLDLTRTIGCKHPRLRLHTSIA
jgi:hypothetical protein